MMRSSAASIAFCSMAAAPKLHAKVAQTIIMSTSVNA
jgi:hypothetical protein